MPLVNEKTADDFYALLRRLYGDTYGSLEEDSVFQRRLRAWAVLLALGRSEIDRAFRQAFPDLSDALIGEWERTFRLPNDSARTLAERQARAAAHERTQRGAARADLQASLDATGTSAAFLANSRTEVLMAGSEPAAIFQTTLQLSNDDFYDPIVRNAVETLWGNALPAKNVGALDRLGPGFSTCVKVDAAWGSLDHHIGRDAIGRQVAIAREEYAPDARIRSFGPGTRIDAADLNAIQETLLGSPLTGEERLTEYAAGTTGLITRWFALSLGGSGLVDESVDWRDRLVVVCGRRSTSADLRPGASGDDKYGSDAAGDDTVYICVYTGSGVDDGYWGSAQGIDVWASPSGGGLYMGGSGISFVGIVWATEQLGMR